MGLLGRNTSGASARVNPETPWASVRARCPNQQLGNPKGAHGWTMTATETSSLASTALNLGLRASTSLASLDLHHHHSHSKRPLFLSPNFQSGEIGSEGGNMTFAKSHRKPWSLDLNLGYWSSNSSLRLHSEMGLSSRVWGSSFAQSIFLAQHSAKQRQAQSTRTFLPS